MSSKGKWKHLLENLGFHSGRQASCEIFHQHFSAEGREAVMDQLHLLPSAYKWMPLRQRKLPTGRSGHQQVPQEASWDRQPVHGGGPSSLRRPLAQTICMSKLWAKLASAQRDGNRSEKRSSEAMVSLK